MCSSCREKKEILVVMCPKVKGIAPENIKPWYMSVELREFARKTYQEATFNTKVYVSDGERFWNWTSWPYNIKNFITWNDFLAACPSWKIVKPEAKTQVYPEMSSYIGC
jgi:hypothetical protein